MSIAAQIRKRAAEKAAEQLAARPVISKTFGEFPFRVRRLDLEAWINSGRVPQFLTHAMLKASKGEESGFNEKDLSADELAKALAFQRLVITETLVEPKISLNGVPADDEIDYTEFALAFPEVVREIVSWQMAGAPDVPVETEGGEMALSTIENFRDDGPRKLPARPRSSVRKVREKTVGTSRNKRQ